MKALKSTILLILSLSAVIATHAQKAYLTGFSGLSVYKGTDIHTQDTVCCGKMVYVTKSFDSSTIFVSHWDDNRLYYIDSMDNIVDSMAVQIWDLVSDDATNTLFASQRLTNQVYIIDPAAKTYDSIAISAPDMLEKRPGKKEVWVVHEDKYTVIDYTGTPTATPHVFTNSNTLGRDEVRFTKDGKTALLVHSKIEKLYKIDADNKTMVDSITIPNLFGVTFSADDSKFYASAGLKNKIYVYNTSSMALVDSIITMRNPFTLYVNPYTGNLWVVDHNHDTLTVVDLSTNKVIDSTHTTTGPYYLVFNKPGPTAVGGLAKNTIDIEVYPNPTNGQLFFSKKADVVSVYNTSGQFVDKHINCSSINTANLSAGMYYLQITTQEGQATKQVIIQ